MADNTYDYRPSQIFKRNSKTFSEFQQPQTPYTDYARKTFGGQQTVTQTPSTSSQQFSYQTQPQATAKASTLFAPQETAPYATDIGSETVSPSATLFAARPSTIVPGSKTIVETIENGDGTSWVVYSDGSRILIGSPTTSTTGEATAQSAAAQQFSGVKNMQTGQEVNIGTIPEETVKSIFPVVNSDGTLTQTLADGSTVTTTNTGELVKSTDASGRDTTGLTKSIDAIKAQYGASLEADLSFIKDQYDAYRNRLATTGGDYGRRGAYEETLTRASLEQLDAAAKAKIANTVAMTQDIAAAVWDDYVMQTNIDTSKFNTILTAASSDPILYGSLIGGVLLGSADMFGGIDVVLPAAAGIAMKGWAEDNLDSYTNREKLIADLIKVGRSTYENMGYDPDDYMPQIESSAEGYAVQWDNKQSTKTVVPDLPSYGDNGGKDGEIPGYFTIKYDSLTDEAAVTAEIRKWITAGYAADGKDINDINHNESARAQWVSEINKKTVKFVNKWKAALGG